MNTTVTVDCCSLCCSFIRSFTGTTSQNVPPETINDIVSYCYLQRFGQKQTLNDLWTHELKRDHVMLLHRFVFEESTGGNLLQLPDKM